MARPTKYTKALATSICEQIAHGAGLKSICHPNEMPCIATIFSWLADDKHAEFLDMYERARERQQEYWADEIIEIADDGTNDFVEREAKNGKKFIVCDHDQINRSKLRVDTRKWLMSKLAPRKYGASKQIEADITQHVKVIILEGDEE